MIQTNPSKQTFFSHLGIIFTLLLFSFAAQAQNIAIGGLGSWQGSVSPATITKGGAVTVNLIQYQCNSANLTITADGVDVPVISEGNVSFSTSNGFTFSSTSGGYGVLNLNVPGEYCNHETTGFDFILYLEYRNGTVYYSSDPFPPYVSVKPTALSAFETCPTNPSAARTFTITGGNLTNNVEVKALAGYEYSLDGSTYQSTVSIPPAGGTVDRTVYVRLQSGNSVNTYAGQIECTTNGATSSAFVDVTSSVTSTIEMTLDKSTITNLDYKQGNHPSAAQEFFVSALCLNGNITITATGDFQVSTTSATAGFASSATLTSSGGSVWVRLNAANPGHYTGSVSVVNGTAGITSPQTVAVSGTVAVYDCNNNPYRIHRNNDQMASFSDVSICALDECGFIYELNATTAGDGQYYAQLSIVPKAGSNPESDALELYIGDYLGSGIEVKYDGNKQLVFDNVGHQKFTFYVDMRDPNIAIITASRPILTEPVGTVEGKTEIPKCSSVFLDAVVCPDPAGGYSIYQWYKNGSPLSNATSANLNEPSIEGDRYYFTASDGSKTITSNEITITYEPAPKLHGSITLTGYSDKLNYYEHNVKSGDVLTFTQSPYDPLTIDSYTLQYKSLAVGSEWRDTTIVPTIGSDITYTIIPKFGAKYRIKAIDDVNHCKEYFSDSVLLRFIYDCSENVSWDLFREDFGYFQSGTYHYGNGQSTTTDVHSLAYPSGSYWAADPTNRVQGHYFAWEEGTVHTWCNGINDNRRIEDNYYAIVNNPASGDCKNYDYWNGTDHTGNSNGAMLFVNVAGSALDKVVYKQEITIDGDCKDVKVLFSAFINNATPKGHIPVDVRLDVWDESETDLLYSISSGEIITRTQATASNSWANLSFMFEAEEGKSYWMNLTNNAPSGSGNDILIDDISVTICVPEIKLILTDTPAKSDIVVCEDNITVKLESDPTGEQAIKDLFGTPLYQYQYSKTNGATWENFGSGAASVEDNIDVELIYNQDSNQNTYKGETLWRIIAAGSQSTINSVVAGSVSTPSCSEMFLISNTVKVVFDHNKYDNVTEEKCFGEEFTFTAEIPSNGKWEWYNADASGTVTGAVLRSGAWTTAKPNVDIQITTPANTTPIYYVFRSITKYDCQFDYLVTVTGRDCDDLVLEKSASAAEIDAGDELQYTITVSNKSLFGTRNITVYDKLPATMSYRSHTITPSSAGTYSKETGEWNIARLETNDEAALTITVRNIGGADSDIINYAFIKNRTKEAVPEETDSYSDYEDAKANKPAFADTAKVYVTPTEIPGILGNQPCKDDVVTYSLNEDIVPLKPNLEYKWSILPVGQTGAYIQGSSTDATFEVKYYQAPAEYEIVCVVVDPDLTDPPITQTKKVYVTDVPNVTITGKMDVCYGDIEKYSALSDNTPYGDYKWTLSSGENELIIKGAHSQTSTVEWLPSNGAPTFDVVQVELTNTSAWASCSNSAMLPVTIHPNPLIDFSYDGSSTKYFESEPAYRHTDSIYANVPVKFINESHTLGSVNDVEFYWDYAGDGIFSQSSYDGENTYHYPGDYMVQLLAIDNTWGCKTIIEKPLEVLPNPNCIASFPNAFTPTQESNKVFGALYTNGVLYEGFELRVYDRWGTMLWSTNAPYEYWDGTYRGEMGKQDVYIYHCKAVCEAIDPATGNRKSLSIKGDVTLIR